MARENKGEYKEFRSLLRCGIGTKTQKAFAEEIDISKEHLNRLLNNREISRPSIGLLKKNGSAYADDHGTHAIGILWISD